MYTFYYVFLIEKAAFLSISGIYQVMQAPCLVDLLGMDRLARAYGLLQVASGVAFLISPPLGGNLGNNVYMYIKPIHNISS